MAKTVYKSIGVQDEQESEENFDLFRMGMRRRMKMKIISED